MNWLGELLRELNPIIAIVPAFAAAYFTYTLGKRKSQREEWERLYNEMKERTEKAEKQNIKLQHTIDDYYKKYGDL